MGNFFSDLWDDITGKTPAKMQREAIDQSQAAINTQQAWEREQGGRLNAMQNWLWNLGTSNLVDPSTGLGKAATAENWVNKYLDYLTNIPETEFQAGKGEIEKQTAGAQDAAAKAMRSRGLTRTGLATVPFGQIATSRAGMLGDLARQKETRKGEALSTGAQLTQNLMDKLLNLVLQSAQLPGTTQTQVPGMMQNQASLIGKMGQAGSPLMSMATSLAPALLEKFGGREKATTSAQANPYLATMASPNNPLGTLMSLGLKFL